MNIQEYLRLSEKTLSNHFIVDSPSKQKMLHAAIGIATESGELLDQFKKHVFYNKDLDVVNIQEELGDIMWYMAILLRELELDFYKILEDNIIKLKKRYGEKFDDTKAVNRNIQNELDHFSH